MVIISILLRIIGIVLKIIGGFGIGYMIIRILTHETGGTEMSWIYAWLGTTAIAVAVFGLGFLFSWLSSKILVKNKEKSDLIKKSPAI
jgi:hypothetical protein